MRTSIYASVLLIAAAQFAGATAFAQQLALVPGGPDCPSVEPDSVQISWTDPCENGDWLFDTKLGCRMWDWHPDLKDKAVWSGACPGGKKEGLGTLQWYEHGQRIDRFEGTFHDGKRVGLGRYSWNDANSFEGQYVNDLPHGPGTARLAGVVFAGEWRNGCFTANEKTVAIGVPRRSCTELSASVSRDPQSSR
jgi:hypothetical protein